jgi:hypothetical protein
MGYRHILENSMAGSRYPIKIKLERVCPSLRSQKVLNYKGCLPGTCECHRRKEVEGYLPIRFGILDFFALSGRLQSLVVSVLKIKFC